MMRALIHTEYGDAERLSVGTVAKPAPGPGEVLIEVRAASVNTADVFQMRGVPRAVRMGNGVRRPRRTVLGHDLAGVVAELGEGVTSIAVGDRVFGEGIAAFAEFAVARADRLARVPEGMCSEHAASLPMAGLTALKAMEVARVQPGQRVVVTGAAGGVGQFALQLAKLRGAYVIAVCSGRNVDRVRELGPDEVIDYETQDVLATIGTCDVIIDNAGGIRIKDWRGIVPKGGVILPNAGVRGPDGGALMRVAKAQWHSIVAPQRVGTFLSKTNSAGLAHIGELAASGHIRPLVDTMFTLDHAPEALARVGTHHARGKVIVTMDEGHKEARP